MYKNLTVHQIKKYIKKTTDLIEDRKFNPSATSIISNEVLITAKLRLDNELQKRKSIFQIVR